MAERPIKPQALNTLTSFYKNKAQEAVKDCVFKQIIWLYYGTSETEMKDGNKFSASLWWKTGQNETKQNNNNNNKTRSNLAIRKEENFLCN